MDSCFRHVGFIPVSRSKHESWSSSPRPHPTSPGWLPQAPRRYERVVPASHPPGGWMCPGGQSRIRCGARAPLTRSPTHTDELCAGTERTQHELHTDYTLGPMPALREHCRRQHPSHGDTGSVSISGAQCPVLAGFRCPVLAGFRAPGTPTLHSPLPTPGAPHTPTVEAGHFHMKAGQL